LCIETEEASKRNIKENKKKLAELQAKIDSQKKMLFTLDQIKYNLDNVFEATEILKKSNS